MTLYSFQLFSNEKVLTVKNSEREICTCNYFLKTFFNKCLEKNERDIVIDDLLVVQDDLKIINIVNELAQNQLMQTAAITKPM